MIIFFSEGMKFYLQKRLVSQIKLGVFVCILSLYNNAFTLHKNTIKTLNFLNLSCSTPIFIRFQNSLGIDNEKTLNSYDKKKKI